jgi:hypothetical protein
VELGWIKYSVIRVTFIELFLVINKLWIAVTVSAILGPALFHLFAYLHNGPGAITFLPISLPIGASVIAVIAEPTRFVIGRIRNTSALSESSFGKNTLRERSMPDGT